MLSREESKTLIIQNFNKNVLGKNPLQFKSESNHKGKIGHWLETNLGGVVDADGNADLNGFECKKESKKVSWGDWGPNYRIFADKSYETFNKQRLFENMWSFVKTFGAERIHSSKGLYHSLSGSHVPQKVNDLTNFGLSLEENLGDISLLYNHEEDKRLNKNQIPREFQKNNLLIYKWFGTDLNFHLFKNQVISQRLPIEVNFTGVNASVSLEERIRRKFGVYGVVIGLHDESKGFYGLKFLKQISFKDWISYFRKKDIIYDTALTTKNRRPYNQWRSTEKFMGTLEEETYIP